MYIATFSIDFLEVLGAVVVVGEEEEGGGGGGGGGGNALHFCCFFLLLHSAGFIHFGAAASTCGPVLTVCDSMRRGGGKSRNKL